MSVRGHIDRKQREEENGWWQETRGETKSPSLYFSDSSLSSSPIGLLHHALCIETSRSDGIFTLKEYLVIKRCIGFKLHPFLSCLDNKWKKEDRRCWVCVEIRIIYSSPSWFYLLARRDFCRKSQGRNGQLTLIKQSLENFDSLSTRRAVSRLEFG